MHRYPRPALRDILQRDLLRQAAECCVPSCLRALEPMSWGRLSTRGFNCKYGHDQSYPESRSYCDASDASLQAASLHLLLRRLVHRQNGFFRALPIFEYRACRRPKIMGYELMAFLAEVFVPAASREGHWALAADEVALLLRSLSGVATPEGRCLTSERKYLTLLTVPALWSLIGGHPILVRPASWRTTRAQRLQQNWAVSALFDALLRLPELPPSVQLVAGVLAAVSGPAGADAWIESARQTAETHGTRAFARFFAQLSVNL